MKSTLATTFLLVTILSMPAHAGFISGNQTTDGGKTVNLQGLEWMPLTYTAGMSRTEVEAAGGFTDRFGGVWNAGDWRYATRAETETLLGSLWGGNFSGWSFDNYDGASWFLQTFGGLSFDTGTGPTRVNGTESNQFYLNFDSSNFLFGNAQECILSSSHSCMGRIANLEDYYESLYATDVTSSQYVASYLPRSGKAGMLEEYQGLNAGFSSENNFEVSSYATYDTGSLLVRTAAVSANPVSSPTVISLFAFGLGGLLLRRRKITA